VRERGWGGRIPPLRRAWDVLGPVNADLARRLGLSAECRVVCGIHDSNASYLAHRAERAAPFAVLSTGTWVIAMAAGAALERLREEEDALANVDAFGDPVTCMRFMGGREYAAIAGEAGLGVDPDLSTVADVIARGVLALPSFARQGGPFRDRPGRIEGSAPDDARARAALASLYCALVTDWCLERLEARGECIVEGSFARNATFCAILAALRPSWPVRASEDETGTLSGAALLSHEAKAARPPALRPCPPAILPALGACRARWRAAVDAPQTG
jgi:sugar (pentulose or hexulose) kinase